MLGNGSEAKIRKVLEKFRGSKSLTMEFMLATVRVMGRVLSGEPCVDHPELEELTQEQKASLRTTLRSSFDEELATLLYENRIEGSEQFLIDATSSEIMEFLRVRKYFVAVKRSCQNIKKRVLNKKVVALKEFGMENCDLLLLALDAFISSGGRFTKSEFETANGVRVLNAANTLLIRLHTHCDFM